jgi:nucleoside-diphosphate-sugar epimerase
MHKILITGGTGFIGVRLVKRLHELGHNLKLLIRESSNIQPFQNLKNIEYTFGDVRDIDSLYQATNDVDVIYHLAACTQIWASNSSIFDEININGSENIAKVALEKKILLIYISSFFAIGPYPAGSEIPNYETYERNIDFFMDYERTKYYGTKKVKEYIEKGLKTIIFYPGFVYGPGDFNFYGKLTIDIILGKLLGIPKPSHSRFSMAYVYDIVEGMVKVIDRQDLIGENFFLGGEYVRTIDYLDSIAEIADVKKPRRFPMWLGLIYGWYCEIKAKLTKKLAYITRALMRMATYDWAYSSEKAIEKIGYKITPFDDALRETIAWYLKYVESIEGKKDKKK